MKELTNQKTAKLFVTDCETATSDRFDEDKDLKDVLEDEELFKKTFPYFYKKWVESFEKMETNRISTVILFMKVLFQKKSQWLMMNMSAQLTSKLLLVEELLKKAAEKK